MSDIAVKNAKIIRNRPNKSISPTKINENIRKNREIEFQSAMPKMTPFKKLIKHPSPNPPRPEPELADLMTFTEPNQSKKNFESLEDQPESKSIRSDLKIYQDVFDSGFDHPLLESWLSWLQKKCLDKFQDFRLDLLTSYSEKHDKKLEMGNCVGKVKSLKNPLFFLFEDKPENSSKRGNVFGVFLYDRTQICHPENFIFSLTHNSIHYSIFKESFFQDTNQKTSYIINNVTNFHF